MKLLALDTSSLSCSVALQTNDDIVDRHELHPREHTRLLIPMIREVLDHCDIALRDLDAIILGNGPGSFIGMRIATSVAQGLAYAASVRIVPVSSLLAVAAEVSAASNCDDVAVCQDAHMNEVYLGLYTADGDGVPKAIDRERLHGQSAIGELEGEPGRFVAAGFGWQRYPALLEANRAYLRSTSDILYPRARFLLAAGRDLFERGAAVDPQDIDPAYLRQTVASKPDLAQS